jgi:hypothetical protein
MYAFLVLLAVTLTVYWMTKDTEGFETRIRQETVKKPVEAVTQRLQGLPAKDLPAPSAPSLAPGSLPTVPALAPGSLPNAPFEQTAAMSPLPYQDTTEVKANRQQLINALEMLKGFLAFEAQNLAERSDPAIQLPLQTARSDFHTLQAEVSVLNRNPGLQPTITLTHLTDISNNLAFLQQKVRLLGTASTLQGPMNLFEDPKPFSNVPRQEGFQAQAQTQTQTQDLKAQGPAATPEELKAFLARVEGERARLAASATTDPVVQARVTQLTVIRQDVRQILEQLATKKLLPSEIPILKSDVDKAFPILGKPSEPLPELLRAAQLPAGLANLLPSNVQKDPDTRRQIAALVDKYADTIVNGLSARFEVAYQPQPSEKARRQRSTIDRTGFPSNADLDHLMGASFLPVDQGAITDRDAQLPQMAGRVLNADRAPSTVAMVGQSQPGQPAHFDWKERAKQIEDQIRKRGLRPEDFGVLPRSTKVSADFSWKGYAKMLCTRLQATMDPALPETCGCPPLDWKGWE